MIVELGNRSLIKVSGKDAEDFLHSQLSNDIKNLDPNSVQINAYCQHQGKIVAILWVFKRKNSFYISLPTELKEKIIKRLTMFRLMSQVDIEDHSLKVKQFGIIDEKIEQGLHIVKNQYFMTSISDDIDYDSNLDDWNKTSIDNLLPEVFQETSEKFTPQALNLDINEIGVSFSKGCYPGQEVVARMHYLGKAKRRLYHFISENKVKVGDGLNVIESTSLKSSGQVIRVLEFKGVFHFLATFEIKYSKDSIFINNNINNPVALIHG